MNLLRLCGIKMSLHRFWLRLGLRLGLGLGLWRVTLMRYGVPRPVGIVRVVEAVVALVAWSRVHVVLGGVAVALKPSVVAAPLPKDSEDMAETASEVKKARNTLISNSASVTTQA